MLAYHPAPFIWPEDIERGMWTRAADLERNGVLFRANNLALLRSHGLLRRCCEFSLSSQPVALRLMTT